MLLFIFIKTVSDFQDKCTFGKLYTAKWLEKPLSKLWFIQLGNLFTSFLSSILPYVITFVTLYCNYPFNHISKYSRLLTWVAHQNELDDLKHTHTHHIPPTHTHTPHTHTHTPHSHGPIFRNWVSGSENWPVYLYFFKLPQGSVIHILV